MSLQATSVLMYDLICKCNKSTQQKIQVKVNCALKRINVMIVIVHFFAVHMFVFSAISLPFWLY